MRKKTKDKERLCYFQEQGVPYEGQELFKSAAAVREEELRGRRPEGSKSPELSKDKRSSRKAPPQSRARSATSQAREPGSTKKPASALGRSLDKRSQDMRAD